MQVLEHVTDGPPARWATSRAAVAFWGLGRASAADELAAARTGDAAEQARMRSVEALMRLQLNDLDRARALAHGVLGDEAADAPAERTARCVLAYLAAAGGDPDASAELLSGSAGRQDTATLQYAVPMALGARVSIGLDLAGIDEVLAAEFAGLAQSGGFGFGSGWASLLQAQGAWLRGRTTVAVEACEQACAALTANRIYNGNAHAARAFALAVRGDVELAEEAMATAEAAAGHCDGLFYPWQTQARAWTSACAGDVPGAVRLLQDLILRLRADGLAGHELLALHDLVRLGRADLAADRMQALLGTVPGGRAAHLLMRHARAAAGGSGNALLAVAREFNTNGYLVFAAEAAAAAVRLFRLARDPQAVAANTLLADVLDRCDSVHTPALRSVRPALTNRERQVARLAANGAKSREIAHQLFLSPRTVENHLQRVYAKLGVNGRDALAPALRSLPQ
jgi:DNA-binding CsgD family transcriptional regulator